MRYKEDEPQPDEAEQPCWLCGRALGDQIELHHPVPRSRGGRVKVALHPICHKTIHANFTNGELARNGSDLAQVRSQPAVARFLEWIGGKPPDFHAPTRRGR